LDAKVGYKTSLNFICFCYFTLCNYGPYIYKIFKK